MSSVEIQQQPVGDGGYNPQSSLRGRRSSTEPQRQQMTTSNDLITISRTASRTAWPQRRTLSTLLTPERPLGKTPTILQSLKATVLASWLNVLLVFIPVSWGLHFAKQSDILIFVFSFLAIIPLAKLLGFATEELALRVGQTIGGLLNATLGNAVELIVAIIALTQCKLAVVQSSLVGSILSNILLVLGMCFFAGGTRFSEQGFLQSAANVNSSLLTLSVIAVLIPAAFVMAVDGSQNNPQNASPNAITSAAEGVDILKMSRGVAVVLLFIYASYLVFQLWSHAHLYDENAKSGSTQYPEKTEKKKPGNEAATSTGQNGDLNNNVARLPDDPEAKQDKEPDVEEVEQPQMSVAATIVLLIIVTVLVAVTAEWLVDSLDGVTAKGNISQQWVGLILLPIVGNAAEHVTAVTVSVKDKLTLSLGVAVGSSIQIALFVIPFITILAWIMNKPLTLLFDPFLSVVLFLAVITVNYCVQDAKSNWLEGMILMCLYVIIAISFWFYPPVDFSSHLGLTCTI